MPADKFLPSSKSRLHEEKRKTSELTNEIRELNSKLVETKRELKETKKELSELLSIFDNNVDSKEAAEYLLRKAKGSIQKIKVLEKQISQLKTTNQNWETSYHLAQGKLNQVSEREEKLLDDKYKEITILNSQITNLTSTLNYTHWELNNLRQKFSQSEKEKELIYYSQEEFDALFKKYKKEKQKQAKKLADLEKKLLNYQNSYQTLKGQFYQQLEVNRILQAKIIFLQSQLDTVNDKKNDGANEIDKVRKQLRAAEEKVEFFRKRALVAEKLSRASETTLVGDEDDYQETTKSSTQNTSTQTVNDSPGWKSRFWKTAKKLGITALVATGGYQTGYYRGVNSKTTNQTGLIQFNTVNSTQIFPPYCSLPATNSPFEKNPKNLDVPQNDNNSIVFVPNKVPSLDNKTEVEVEEGKNLTDDKPVNQKIKDKNKQENSTPLNSAKDVKNLETESNTTQADSTNWKDHLDTALRIIAEKDKKIGELTAKLDNQELILCKKAAELNATQAALEEEEQRKENFNQQLDETQQELVRTKREKRKLSRKLNYQKTQKTKTQTQFKEYTSYLQNILRCLASAGMGCLKSWKSDQTLSETDIQELEEGINKLIKQRDQAWKERDEQKNNQNETNQKSGETSASCACSKNYQRGQKENIYQDNQQAIIQEINNSLKLNLQSPTLKQVISKIQELINKDPMIETINTPFGEDLQVIKELEISSLEQLFPNQLEVNFINQIKQANNYQQLTEIRNEFLSKHLKPVQSKFSETAPFKKQYNIERYVWVSLLALSLTSLGIMWIKLINKKGRIISTSRNSKK